MYMNKLGKIVYRWWLQWLDTLNSAVLLQPKLDGSATEILCKHVIRISHNPTIIMSPKTFGLGEVDCSILTMSCLLFRAVLNYHHIIFMDCPKTVSLWEIVYKLKSLSLKQKRMYSSVSNQKLSFYSRLPYESSIFIKNEVD